MSKVLIEESTLTAIGDSIRSKTGGSDLIAPGDMPSEISGITTETEDLILPAGIPDYVREEVLELVNKVNAVRTDDSIVFLAMSDSHYPADQTATTSYTSNVKSTVQANQAAKTLAYMLNIDFFAHLGDVCVGASTTTPEMLKAQIDGFLSYFREANSELPVFLAIGNHDNGVYYHETINDGNDYIMPGTYMYNTFTAHAASEDTVFGDTAYGGYCYRDFTDKKLRVFLLNTCEESLYYRADRGATLGSQRVWLANALLELNSKSDAADWKYIILCHYPADYGATMPLSELLKAYVEGGSVAISVEDGTSSTVSFSGKNGAKFMAQFHGHVHNFLVSKLHSYSTGSGVKYDAWRICIPNVQFDRENYYTTVGSYTDINFAEDTSYNKTADTANGTAFVVNVINPGEEKIYSFCYGAGYDRVIGIAATVYYSITQSLTNVTTSNDATSVEAGEAYSATITPSDGYDISSVSVTMGGEDVTSTVYADGVITIADVTGNVVITATAVKVYNVTNQLPISTDTDGSIYNGVGYKADSYISSGNVSTKSGYYTTGFIPVSPGDTLYFENCGFGNQNSYNRIAFYDSSKSYLSSRQFSPANAANANITFNLDADGYVESAVVGDVFYMADVAYARICCPYFGEDSVITVNEVIE